MQALNILIVEDKQGDYSCKQNLSQRTFRQA